MTSNQTRAIQWVFYGALGLFLTLIVTGALAMIAPSAISTRVSYNSEAYLFALVLASWIQFALPRLRGPSRVIWALVHGSVWALVGVALVLGALWVSDFPGRLATLNEPAFALALLIPYVTIHRPLSRWILVIVPGMIALIAWAVVRSPDSWVIDQAETFGFVILAILTFDLFDRTLLDRQAHVNRGLRWTWYGFMVLEPIAVSVIGTAARAGDGPLALALEYLGRIHESFVGVLLVAFILHIVRIRRRP